VFRIGDRARSPQCSPAKRPGLHPKLLNMRDFRA
jgi:hypothetical protein